MSWRIVVVHNTAKLDLQLQYLVVRSEMKTQKIHISEVCLSTAEIHFMLVMAFHFLI